MKSFRIFRAIFSTKSLSDNRKSRRQPHSQAGFRPLCNKIPLLVAALAVIVSHSLPPMWCVNAVVLQSKFLTFVHMKSFSVLSPLYPTLWWRLLLLLLYLRRLLLLLVAAPGGPAVGAAFSAATSRCCSSSCKFKHESIDFIEKLDHSQSSLSQCFQALSLLEANSVFSCTQQFDVRLSLLFVHILFFPVFTRLLGNSSPSCIPSNSDLG